MLWNSFSVPVFASMSYVKWKEPRFIFIQIEEDLLSMEFFRQEYWSGSSFPSPGNLPNPGIKSGSPTLWADSLPCEPPVKPKKKKAYLMWGFPGGSVSKESTCNAGDLGSTPGSGTSPQRRKGQPTPVFLLGKSHGQRSLAAPTTISLFMQ